MKEPKHHFLIGCMLFFTFLGLSQSAVAGLEYTYAGSIDPPDETFINPQGMIIDHNQNLLVTVSGAGIVRGGGLGGRGILGGDLYQFTALGAYKTTFSGPVEGPHFAPLYGIGLSGTTLYLSEMETPGGEGLSRPPNQGHLRSFIYDGTQLTALQTSTEVTGLPRQVALGTYNGTPYVYMGTETVVPTEPASPGPQYFFQFPTNLSGTPQAMGGDLLRRPAGIAIDSRGIIHVTNGGTQILRFTQDGTVTSPLPYTFTNAMSVAITASGHILVADAVAGNNAIIVLLPDGSFDSIIPINVTAEGAILTHLTSNHLTGRVYVSTTDPDNRIYMVDVSRFMPPCEKFKILPDPPPQTVTDAVTLTAERDINYQIALDNLDGTSDLQALVDSYEDPNSMPFEIAAVRNNASIVDVVQNHISSLQSQQASNSPQHFQSSDHQYLADFRHRGLAAHMQKKSRTRKQLFLSGQPSEHYSGLEAAPTLEFMSDQHHFSVWMQNAFNQTDNGITSTTDANRSRMHAWTFGADAQVAKQSRVGVFGGSSKSKVHLMRTPLTKDDTKKKYLGLYGVHFFDIKKENINPTLDVNVMLGKGHIDHARDLSMPGYSMIATSRQGFWDLTTRVRLTVSHHMSEHLTLSPYVYAGWMYFKENQVTEQGASLFNQNRPSQMFQVAEGSIGTTLSANFDQSFGMVIPSLKLGITKTSTINQQKVIPISLAGGGTFESAQVPLKQFAYDIGPSLAFKLKNNLSFVASYLAEYGKNKYKRNEVLIEARLYF